jgi:hypothetical protein
MNKNDWNERMKPLPGQSMLLQYSDGHSQQDERGLK